MNGLYGVLTDGYVAEDDKSGQNHKEEANNKGGTNVFQELLCLVAEYAGLSHFVKREMVLSIHS